MFGMFGKYSRNIGPWFQSDAGGAGGSGAGAGSNGQSKDQGAGGQGGSGQGAQGTGAGKQPLHYDEWLKSQPEEVQSLLSENVKGLKSALADERESRGKLEKQVRDLASKADKGSELEKQLTRTADDMAEADRKAEFYEEAHRAGVSNLKLAYIVALTDERFDKKGRVDFEAMKKDYPEMFGGKPKTAEGNAGNGTNKAPASGGMNAFIRKSAGRE